MAAWNLRITFSLPGMRVFCNVNICVSHALCVCACVCARAIFLGKKVPELTMELLLCSFTMAVALTWEVPKLSSGKFWLEKKALGCVIYCSLLLPPKGACWCCSCCCCSIGDSLFSWLAWKIMYGTCTTNLWYSQDLVMVTAFFLLLFSC